VTEKTRRSQFISIQILRGIAAMMVVFVHLSESSFAQAAGITSGFSLGHAGVDVFFVISGFVMFVSTDGRDMAPGTFWKARAIRIIPLYYLATLLFLGGTAVFEGLPPEFSAWEVVKTFAFIPFNNSLNGQPVPILGVGWTLNYEVLFYVVFGLTLLLRDWYARIGVMFAVFTLLCAGRFIFSPDDAFWMRTTSPITMEFMAGILCGVWATRRDHVCRPVIGGAAIIAGFTLAAIVAIRFPSLPRTIGFGVPAVMIVGGFVMIEDICRNRLLGGMHFLGDASYSIYLTHGMAIRAATYLFVPGSLFAGMDFALLAVGAPACGVLCYMVIEKPMTAKLKSIFSARSRSREVVGGAIGVAP